MRKSRFTEAQIIGMIKEQEAGLPTSERGNEYDNGRMRPIRPRRSALNRPEFTGG